MKKNKIIKELNDFGFCKIHFSELECDSISNLYNKNKTFVEEVVSRDHVIKRKNLLKQGNPIVDRNKFYEFQSKQLMGEGLSLDNSPIIQFYLQDFFLDVAEEYLQKEDIRLRNCTIMYHPENPFPPSNSQRWHRDTEDKQILKIFVYYNDVSIQNGALHYVKSSGFGKKNSKIWPNINDKYFKGAYLNSMATNKIPQEDILTADGKEGTVCFFDSNGFHKGGQVASGERIATVACYLRSTAPQIVNGYMSTFDYTKEGNILDKKSNNYKKLSERQKKLLQ
tara:strand:- start:7127 stop:7969 length:843 start_codon:yes stop_codon:yes gene_type:complete